jgi:hypothetical protein
VTFAGISYSVTGMATGDTMGAIIVETASRGRYHVDVFVHERGETESGVV